jgi:FlaA1/EpsC-like NDP-sugar epimerase
LSIFELQLLSEMRKRVFVRQRSVVIVVIQVVLIALSAAFAWLLRFDFAFPQAGLFLWALPLLVGMRLAAMARFNLFHGYWRYTGMSDALDIVKAVALGSMGFLIAERWIVGAASFPISVYFIEAILTAGALGGVRILSRAFMQRVQVHAHGISGKSVVVIGAGCGAAMLLRELPRSGYTVLALVDDDPAKAGVRLHGVRVAGKVKDLREVVRHYGPAELMIAIPSATREEMRRITERCQETGLRFRTIPGLADLIHGTVTVEQLREVNLEDLLGREPVEFNLQSVRRKIAGRVVMVTGAAGSIGSELCDQLLMYGPAKLVCVDQAETPLFHLQRAHSRPGLKAVYCVADVTDSARMRDLIEEHDVRAIFHAAAYKHVSLMEENLQEAVKNNVFGLLSLIEVAGQSGCEDFLLISSDKAVHPTSFMGCTKRIGELIVASRPSGQMRCVSVRFGNVLGSQGSVIPLFQEQIRTHRQITVTDPNVTRYFMTIPEAVSLVLQAFTIGGKGDILVLDMGQPVRILDMAETLIRLSGIPRENVKIVFSGLRPGEKLFEELFYDFEGRSATEAQKVLRTRSRVTSWQALQAQLQALHAESATGSPERIRSKVKEIVPQYQWEPAEESHRKPVQTAKEPVMVHVGAALSSATD